jgi:TRAP-type mannitol/chloroaromatic compound transport system permease small subunit
MGWLSMVVLESILRRIDFICTWTAKLASVLVVFLVLVVVYEVVSRYGFDAPTIWAWEISRMLGGSLFVLGFAWVLIIKSHVRVDLLYKRLSLRGQAILDVVFTLIMVFPLWIAVMPRMIEWTLNSWAIHEVSSDSAWRVIVYPLKTVAPTAIFLLLLALVATFIRDLRTIVRGK